MRVDAQGTDLPRHEIVLIFFAYFPSEYSVGPAISVRRLAKHLSRYVKVRIVTLNYDETTRRPLFPEPRGPLLHAATLFSAPTRRPGWKPRSGGALLYVPGHAIWHYS